jgi:hypothetical protein
MISSFDVLILLFSIFAIAEVVFGRYVRRLNARLEHRIRVEHARAQFADAREKLVKFAINGQIDSRSQKFRELYHAQTFIMRRPDQFDEIGKVLRTSVFATLAKDESNPGTQIRPEIIEVLRPMTAGVALLIIDQSWATRTLMSWGAREEIAKKPEEYFISVQKTLRFVQKIETYFKPQLRVFYGVEERLKTATA